MKISTDHLRNIPSFPKWKIYFRKFPACISSNNRWPSEEGISISFTIIKQATNHSAGTVSIAFLDDPLGKVRQFLHDWQEGVWETNTGKQASGKDLVASVTIRDENEAQSEINLSLSFPTEADIGSETPQFTAIYYE